MPKTFYTEHEIEDLVKRGVTSLELNDNTVLTELAYEKAGRLGLKLTRPLLQPPSAPVRPYIARETQPGRPPENQPAQKSDDLRQRIREAVTARLGSQVDPTLLDGIINRVLENVEKKP